MYFYIRSHWNPLRTGLTRFHVSGSPIFPEPFSFSRLMFLRAVHRGTPHRVPSSFVVAQSSGVPTGFFLPDFRVYVHGVPPPEYHEYRTIRMYLLTGVSLIHSGFGTSLSWGLVQPVH